MKKIFLFTLLALGFCSFAQNFQWAKNMGGTVADEARSIAIDSMGNVYTVGKFQGTCDFDPGNGIHNITGVGQDNMFISKLDADGKFVWAKTITGNDAEAAYSVTIDAKGNIYTTGYFNGTVDFDPGSATNNLTAVGGINIFILKLNALGNYVWAKNMTGTGYSLGSFITTDVSGNVYTTGIFVETTDFDPGSGTTNLVSAGAQDIFISKLDASGNFVWAKKMGGVDSDQPYFMKVDPSGNIYTTGSFKGIADFDPGANKYELTSVGSYDIYISKLDSSGNFIWTRGMGGPNSDDEGHYLTLDTKGNIYITGNFQGTVDFDPGSGTFNMTGAYDVFILKLNSSGNFVWAKKMGGTNTDIGFTILLDPSGNIFTAGAFSGDKGDFDPGPGIYNLTKGGAFISKLDSSGNFVWAKSFVGTSAVECYSMILDASGNIYTTGYFHETIDFDPGSGVKNLISAGSRDIFICKLGCVKTIITQPLNQTANVGSVARFIVKSSGLSSTYQWQLNSGSGFSNLSNSAPYSGVSNDTLTITGVNSAQNNYIFRCIIKENDCFETTVPSTLTVKSGKIKSTGPQEIFTIYPNPGNGQINILSKDKIENLVITDPLGKLILHLNPNEYGLSVFLVSKGIFIVAITVNNKTTIQKLIIN